jgi:hypothetical protein
MRRLRVQALENRNFVTARRSAPVNSTAHNHRVTRT